MASKTITARYSGYKGKVAGVQFTAGQATVDDSTPTGKAVIEFAKRQGWAVSGGTASAVTETVAQGKPVTEWTVNELKAYLDANRVQYPSGASEAELLAAIQSGFEFKAQGGAANIDGAAGHDSGTIPPEGAPPVSAPSKPDDAEESARWKTPLSTNVDDDVAPTISVQPTGSSKIAGATATYSVTASGTAPLEYQWQRQAKGTGSYADISGATSASYTTPALTVADNHQDRYRVKISNADGSITSSAYQQAVTAS